MYILVGFLFVSMIIFAASIFDSNRISTILTGIIVIMFSVAVIKKSTEFGKIDEGSKK